MLGCAQFDAVCRGQISPWWAGVVCQEEEMLTMGDGADGELQRCRNVLHE